MGVIAKIRSWVMQEIVLVVSVIAAALSCIFVPFDGQYVTYIDWHTLALLFSLMSVVAGLRFLGVFRLLGEWVVAHTKTKAMIAFSLVGLSFVCSMVITNDVSLITFVPFAIVIMHQAKMDWYMGPVVALMTVAKLVFVSSIWFWLCFIRFFDGTLYGCFGGVAYCCVGDVISKGHARCS